MSKREFVTGTPMPLGHRRQAINSRDKADAALERIAGKVAELIAPAIAEAVAQELKAQGVTTNGSNGRRMPPQDQWDTLPPGDGWDGYNLNDAIDGRNDRKPGPLDEYDFPDELRGDHFANLPD